MHDIYILGSGAMGCLWASYFQPQQTLHFIQRQTLSNEYSFKLLPADITIHGQSISAEQLQSPIKHLILATKAYDALHALESIQDHLDPETQVILLQNGLGSQQAIKNAFPNIRLYACSSTEGAYKQDAHTLVHAGKGSNSIGPLNDQAKQSDLAAWLPEQHFEWHHEIQPILWRKFMINCAINPLTVLYDCQNGELVKQAKYREHMEHVCMEIDQITATLGYQLTGAFDLASNVCRLTSSNFSSMLQDKRNNQITEIDFMTGYLLKQAAKLGTPCPYNEELYQKLK